MSGNYLNRPREDLTPITGLARRTLARRIGVVLGNAAAMVAVVEAMHVVGLV